MIENLWMVFFWLGWGGEGRVFGLPPDAKNFWSSTDFTCIEENISNMVAIIDLKCTHWIPIW